LLAACKTLGTKKAGGSPPTRAADDLRRFTVESTKPPLEAPPERTDESRLATTAARLAEALAAVDAIGSA